MFDRVFDFGFFCTNNFYKTDSYNNVQNFNPFDSLSYEISDSLCINFKHPRIYKWVKKSIFKLCSKIRKQSLEYVKNQCYTEIEFENKINLLKTAGIYSKFSPRGFPSRKIKNPSKEIKYSRCLCSYFMYLDHMALCKNNFNRIQNFDFLLNYEIIRAIHKYRIPDFIEKRSHLLFWSRLKLNFDIEKIPTFDEFIDFKNTLNRKLDLRKRFDIFSIAENYGVKYGTIKSGF